MDDSTSAPPLSNPVSVSQGHLSRRGRTKHSLLASHSDHASGFLHHGRFTLGRSGGGTHATGWEPAADAGAGLALRRVRVATARCSRRWAFANIRVGRALRELSLTKHHLTPQRVARLHNAAGMPQPLLCLLRHGMQAPDVLSQQRGG